MPRGVDQVEDVALSVLGVVADGHGVELDGDAPLPLEVHRVEQLVLHVALVDGTGELEDAVGQSGLPMVDVGDYREIAYL